MLRLNKEITISDIVMGLSYTAHLIDNEVFVDDIELTDMEVDGVDIKDGAASILFEYVFTNSEQDIYELLSEELNITSFYAE